MVFLMGQYLAPFFSFYVVPKGQTIIYYRFKRHIYADDILLAHFQIRFYIVYPAY